MQSYCGALGRCLRIGLGLEVLESLLMRVEDPRSFSVILTGWDSERKAAIFYTSLDQVKESDLNLFLCS